MLRKQIVFGFLVISILITSTVSSRTHIDYIFMEEFNDVEEWNEYGIDLNNWGLGPNGDNVKAESIESQWEINESILKSSGELKDDDYNGLYQQNPLTKGAWSLLVSYPKYSTTQLQSSATSKHWGLILSKEVPDPVGKTGPEYEQERIIIGFTPTFVDVDVGSNTISNDSGSSKIHLFPQELANKYNVWQQYDIIWNEDNLLVYVDEVLVANRSTSYPIVELNYMGIMALQGSSIKFDRLGVTPDYERVLNSLRQGNDKFGILGTFIMLITGSAIIATVGNWYYNRRRSQYYKEISTLIGSSEISQTIKHLFGSTNFYYAVIGVIEPNNEELQNPPLDNIFLELKDHKKLLHPVRLGIMYNLFLYNRYKSTELRDKLDFSQKDLSNHLRFLSQNNHISLSNEFDSKGALSQFVEITDHGRTTIKQILTMLNKITDEVKFLLDDDILYPHK